MKEHVGFQLGVLDETLAADFTFERFFPRVNANVPLQVLPEGEARSARLTGERFPSVDRLVRAQRPPHCKSFAAHGAFVRMFTGVASSVALQRERVPETLPALGALLRLFNGVHSLVSLQVAFRFEGLPAGGADERPRVRVHDLMSLKVHFCFECLIAEWALKGSVLLLLVPQQVVLKSRRIPEFSRTLVAGEQPLLLVRVHVLQQVKLPVEALVADVAHKHLVCLPDFSFMPARAVRGFGLCCCGVILSRI